jgi:hypothetical protein
VPPTHVHFNGSVNLDNTETVMREIVSRVPSGLRRIPDGETGDRGNWIAFQLEKFLQSPWLVPAVPHSVGEGYEIPQVRLADGVDPADLTWPDPGYADAYLTSYATFAALRDQGVIPGDVRFQVEYPTPLAAISSYLAERQDQLLDSYERVMFADLDRLLAAVPADEVAVQWDVAIEFGILEANFSGTGGQFFDAIIAGLARCVNQVPAGIPAGLHLCYGDYGHQHFVQPASLALQVRVLNAVSAAARRPVSFASFTVPQYQHDEAYFAPLADLAADPGTELNFALVPYYPADQAPGTTGEQVLLIDTALAASKGGGRPWGICTECGMGRAAQEEIPGLLDLHREIIDGSRDEQR